MTFQGLLIDRLLGSGVHARAGLERAGPGPPRLSEWEEFVAEPHKITSPQTAEAFLARTVVLVEGISDQLALEALAERRGRNLDAEGISIVPIGGAKNIGSVLDLFGPQGHDVRLVGLCDAAEEGDFKRGLERPASAPTSPAPIWKHSVSTCASQTWRMS